MYTLFVFKLLYKGDLHNKTIFIIYSFISKGILFVNSCGHQTRTELHLQILLVMSWLTKNSFILITYFIMYDILYKNTVKFLSRADGEVSGTTSGHTAKIGECL